MRFLPFVLLPLLFAGCASVSMRDDKFHYWSGEGLETNDRYYIGTKFDHETLASKKTSAGTGFVVGCDMVGSAVLDTLCLPMDFYLNETDGQQRKPHYDESGF